MKYYYNNVPDEGLCRNNLIYTSLISDDFKTFCQWYYNDVGYHGGKNEVVDPTLMEHKWKREVKYLSLMAEMYPQHVPEIVSIDYEDKKIFLNIDGPDFWELSGCVEQNYKTVLSDWQDQMLEILQAHKDAGLYKFSLHPSSYFIVDNKLKSINYFFTYDDNDENIAVAEVLSHISKNRRIKLFEQMEKMQIDPYKKQDFTTLQMLAFESFKNNYPIDFIEKAKRIYE